MATCSLLWLPAVYYGYLQSSMAIYSLLRLPGVYYGYLQSSMAICSLLWLPPVVYYDYTYSLPSELPSLLYATTVLCQPSLNYNNLCDAKCVLPT